MGMFTKTDKEKVNEKFESFDSYTEEDAQKVMDNQEKIEKIASNDTLHKYLADIKLYFQMLGDVFTGKYKKVPVGTYCCDCWNPVVCIVTYRLHS